MDLPALGVLEFGSIAVGIRAMDAAVKAAAVKLLRARSVCPGKYYLLLAGGVASVDASLRAGSESGAGHLIDALFIPNLHEQVLAALSGRLLIEPWDAAGILELTSIAAGVEAADIAAKEADVRIAEIRLGEEMGGKSTVKLLGSVHAVEASLQAASLVLQGRGKLCERVLLPQPHEEIRPFFARGE